MAVCVWLAISWGSTCYFIWPTLAPRIGGQLSSSAAELGEFPCLLFLCSVGRESKKKREDWIGAPFEVLVKNREGERDEQRIKWGRG